MESEVLQEYFKEIVTLLQSCVKPVADECLGKKLINPGTHKSIVLSKLDESDEKARKLLWSVIDICAQQTRDCLGEFLLILERQFIFEELIENIRKSLEEAKERQRKAMCTEDKEQDGHSEFGSTQLSSTNLDTTRKMKLTGMGTSYQDSLSDNEDYYTIPEDVETSGTTTLPSYSTPIPFRRISSQMSTDSGISIASSTSSNLSGPLQETPSGRRRQSVRRILTNTPTTDSSTRSVLTNAPTSDMRKLDSIEEMTRSIRYDLMQREAVGITQQEKIQQLSEKLQHAIDVKDCTLETLKVKQQEIERLKSEMEEKSDLLKNQKVEIQELKETVSKKETAKYEISSESDNREKELELVESTLTHIEQELAHQKQQAQGLREQLEMEQERVRFLREKIHELEQDNFKQTLKHREVVEERNQDMEKLKRQLSQEKKERLVAEGHKSLCGTLIIILVIALVLMAVELWNDDNDGNHCWLNPGSNQHLFS